MKKHVSTLMVFCALVGLVLVGCESPLAPVSDEGTAVAEAVAPTPSKNGNPVVGSVSGVRILTYAGDNPRLNLNTTLNTRLYADGSVGGEGADHFRDFTVAGFPQCIPPQGCTTESDPVCVSFSADGKTAWGVSLITESNWPIFPPLGIPLVAVGDYTAGIIRDNGEGSNAPPDEALFFLLKFIPPFDTNPLLWCELQRSTRLLPVGRGNIQVRAPRN